MTMTASANAQLDCCGDLDKSIRGTDVIWLTDPPRKQKVSDHGSYAEVPTGSCAEEGLIQSFSTNPAMRSREITAHALSHV